MFACDAVVPAHYRNGACSRDEFECATLGYNLEGLQAYLASPSSAPPPLKVRFAAYVSRLIAHNGERQKSGMVRYAPGASLLPVAFGACNACWCRRRRHRLRGLGCCPCCLDVQCCVGNVDVRRKHALILHAAVVLLRRLWRFNQEAQDYAALPSVQRQQVHLYRLLCYL